VDTWRGDDQAGYYGEEVYLDFRRFHDDRYGAFSELLRCTFDEALPYIPDASVDLLHIDGLHTYEAVRHDFENWRPKLSDNAVVLFHDTNVREREFGVWRLWKELHAQFPSFEFLHGHGLGVLAVGRSTSPQVAALCSLADSARVRVTRQRFSLLGERWVLICQSEQLREEIGARDTRIQSLEAEVAARDARVQSLEAEAAAEKQLRAQAAQRARQARAEAARAIAAAKSPVRQHAVPTPAIEIPLSRPIFDTQPIATTSGAAQLPRGTGRRLICVSHVMPYPPRVGNAYRIHRMLTWLAQRNWDILLVVCPLPDETVTERQLTEAAAIYPNIIICQRHGTLLHRLADRDTMLEGLCGRRPRAFPFLLRETEPGDERERKLLNIMRAFCPDVLIELLLHLEAKFDPQVLLAEYVFMTRPFTLLRPSLFKIVDTHDVFSTTKDKVMQYGIDGVLTLDPDIEAKLLNRADLLIAVQEAEAEVLRKLAPQRQVITVGIDFFLPQHPPSSATSPAILFVASRNAMNVKGVKDFLRFAWPLVRRALPESEFRVIGSVGAVAEPALPGVKILGQVEDLTTAYADARVIINPAVAGTGLKIKTIEAICHLRPIVLWPSGVDGLDAELRELCHIATDWFDFARHVIRLAGEEDGAQALIDQRAKLARYFTPETVYAPLDRVLDNT
jgi:hypothetical protein